MLVNRSLLRSVSLPGDPHATDPVLVNLTLPAGENVIAIAPVNGNGNGSGNGQLNLLARLTVTHWAPWSEPAVSPELRFTVTHDRTTANVGERVVCRVKAERVGFRGYGMMPAEIGLPPGAEVDRTSAPSRGGPLRDSTRSRGGLSMAPSRWRVVRILLCAAPSDGGEVGRIGAL